MKHIQTHIHTNKEPLEMSDACVHSKQHEYINNNNERDDNNDICWTYDAFHILLSSPYWKLRVAITRLIPLPLS